MADTIFTPNSSVSQVLHENCGKIVTIYALSHPITGEFYIGSTGNLSARTRQHNVDLKLGNHHSSKMQEAYDKTPGKFISKPILICLKEHSDTYEELCIRTLRPTLNVSMRGRGGALTGNKNHIHRPEVRAKFVGENSPNKRPEVRAKNSAAKMGSKNPAKRLEVKEKIKAAKNKPEVKIKMSWYFTNVLRQKYWGA